MVPLVHRYPSSSQAHLSGWRAPQTFLLLLLTPCYAGAKDIKTRAHTYFAETTQKLLKGTHVAKTANEYQLDGSPKDSVHARDAKVPCNGQPHIPHKNITAAIPDPMRRSGQTPKNKTSKYAASAAATLCRRGRIACAARSDRAYKITRRRRTFDAGGPDFARALDC